MTSNVMQYLFSSVYIPRVINKNFIRWKLHGNYIVSVIDRLIKDNLFLDHSLIHYFWLNFEFLNYFDSWRSQHVMIVEKIESEKILTNYFLPQRGESRCSTSLMLHMYYWVVNAKTIRNFIYFCNKANIFLMFLCVKW